MQCSNCGESVLQLGQEPDYQYNGDGTYLHCHSCQARNYTEEDSGNSGPGQ